MALNSYEKPEVGSGDRVQAKSMANRPMVLRVREEKFIQRTQFNPDGGPAVIVDFVDLADAAKGDDAVKVGVMWMNGAIVDGLKRYIGQTLAIKLVWVKGGGGNDYLCPEALQDAELAVAVQWDQANPGTFDRVVKQRESTAPDSSSPAPGPVLPSLSGNGDTPPAAPATPDVPKVPGLDNITPEMAELLRQYAAGNK